MLDCTCLIMLFIFMTNICQASRISRTLDRIEFVGVSPILENHTKDCHENHAFLHSPYQIFLRTALFRVQAVPMNYLTPMKNYSVEVARYPKLDAGILTLCFWEAPQRELLQTVITQIKCSIMLHFIGVYTVCNGKKDLQTK